ncbi:MAG: D-Ala-D-Ala carboxypeptidase family metallohydrolase [Gammaproteobacteria bacterium]|nr:D-Ala-D-Ala carboxypeptidase family metallohydrolase [Gammaproteobacteria bacterium]
MTDFPQKDYFPLHEQQCRCCGRGRWAPTFHAKMNELREACGFPLPVTSGCRCEPHNARVGGGDLSAHLMDEDDECSSADIHVSGYKAHFVIREAGRLGFAGIGIKQSGDVAKRLIHLDDAPEIPGRPRPWIWSY